MIGKSLVILILILDRYDRLGSVVKKKLVLGSTDEFMGKELWRANHMSKGSSKSFFAGGDVLGKVLVLLESVPDGLLRSLVKDLVVRKKIDFEKLLSDRGNLKNLMIIEVLTSRLENLDKKTPIGDLVQSSDKTERARANFFNESAREKFYEFFRSHLDDAKAQKMQEFKIFLRKKIAKYLLTRMAGTQI